jgi:hypothetical protein
MGPLTLDQLRERLGPQHPDRKLALLGQLWVGFSLRWAFLESAAANAFSATVVAESGVGTLREVSGQLSLQLTPFRDVTGFGARERSDSVQLIVTVGEKELHLGWPAPLTAMLEDETFRWIVSRLEVRS